MCAQRCPGHREHPHGAVGGGVGLGVVALQVLPRTRSRATGATGKCGPVACPGRSGSGHSRREGRPSVCLDGFVPGLVAAGTNHGKRGDSEGSRFISQLWAPGSDMGLTARCGQGWNPPRPGPQRAPSPPFPGSQRRCILGPRAPHPHGQQLGSPGSALLSWDLVRMLGPLGTQGHPRLGGLDKVPSAA